MRSPSDRLVYSELVPRFLGGLFEPGERVVLSRLEPCVGGKPKFRRSSLPREKAQKYLSGKEDVPNLYFNGSAHDGSASYTKDHCVRIRALFQDIDYGDAGHSSPCRFRCLDDAVGYILSVPVSASIVWHTGHGIQACYLLDEPYALSAGGGSSDSLKRFERVSAALGRMAVSDATFTPEHVFRVPLTVNDKRWKHPSIEPVRGELLWLNEERRYSFGQLEAAVANYGIPDAGEHDGGAGQPDKDQPCIHARWEDLPEDLKEDITNSGGDRSVELFRITGDMVRRGYSDHTIQDATLRGPCFVEKYGDRLAAEVARCIAKIREGRYVYNTVESAPVQLYNHPVELKLDACGELPDPLREKLSQYGDLLDIRLPDRVYDGARFFQHVFDNHRTGVLESRCGSGKSTWAICTMALHASEDNRFIYVTETVDALHRAADVLDRLAGTAVGRVHGFNRVKCFELCGQEHSWRECAPQGRQSACSSCEARESCCFYRRDEEVGKRILCMTHEGLARALESDDKVLTGANILIDEGLNPFSTWEVDLEDLECLEAKVAPERSIKPFFPYSSFSSRYKRNEYGIPDDAESFARCNYIFRSAQEAAALDPLCSDLRSYIHGITDEVADIKRVKGEGGGRGRFKETLLDLLNFFRPSAQGDATYALHEARRKGTTTFTVKRSRFSFGTSRKYSKLFILNASAQLSPFPYPDNMAVYSCPGLPDNSRLVTLHTVRGNPFKRKQEDNIWLTRVFFYLDSLPRRQHKDILVTTNKNFKGLDGLKKSIGEIYGTDVGIVHLPRGRIKGVNTAGNCTLGVISPMPTHTTADDCALHAALLLGRTFPDRPHVYNKRGIPNMPGGRYLVPAMQQYYALRSLDEIYQSIWRTAVRNDHRVDAVIAVPDAHWVVALWRTVMPDFELGLALRQHGADKREPVTKVDSREDGNGHYVLITTNGGERRIYPDYTDVRETARHGALDFDYNFQRDDLIDGLRIINSPPGQEFKKADIAEMFGYTGQHPWKENKKTIMTLLDPFFEPGSNGQKLRRRGSSRCDRDQQSGV